MVLRQAVETPGRTAALVTPDRELAGRVAAALPRHGIIADDSAGEALSETPPAVFLRLLARAVADDLAPVPLLALLKHPLAAAGLTPPPAARARARWRSRPCAVRGRCRALPACAARSRVPATRCNAVPDRVEACLEPALRVQASVEDRPGRRAGRPDRRRRKPRRHRRNRTAPSGCGPRRKARPSPRC